MSETPIPDLIRAFSARNGLPIALVSAIVQVESAGSPWAVRYEPAFYDRYIANRTIHPIAPCSLQTERTLRACSFGPMQIMGQTARELGFEGAFLTELCAPEAGIEYGCKNLAAMASRYFDSYGWEGVAAAYNAGSPRKGPDGKWVNWTYVDKIKAAAGLQK